MFCECRQREILFADFSDVLTQRQIVAFLAGVVSDLDGVVRPHTEHRELAKLFHKFTSDRHSFFYGYTAWNSPVYTDYAWRFNIRGSGSKYRARFATPV